MSTTSIIVSIIIFLLILLASGFIYNSYFGIRVRQKGIEKAFNKTLLKDAGFTAGGKRLFEFAFDIACFWFVFIYNEGYWFHEIQNWFEQVVAVVILILPISRPSLMNINFWGYSFIAIMIISIFAALLCGMVMEKVAYFTRVIIAVALFPFIWYANLGICYGFYNLLHIGLNSTLYNCALSIVCYVVVIVADFIVLCFFVQE